MKVGGYRHAGEPPIVLFILLIVYVSNRRKR
jgi:hypothetical protein